MIRLLRGGLLPAAFILFGILPLSGCGPRKDGGGKNILRYALQNPPTQIDPAMVEDGDTIDLVFQIFEGLVKWSPENRVVPNLAEKWDVSPDGKVYTFHLKHGVKFHNGREVKAEDFVYSITRALSRRNPPSSTVKTYLNDIAGALDVFNDKAQTVSGLKAVDDYTVQITIDAPRAYFLAKLTYPTSYVVCKEVVEANGGKADEKAAIGTGPFKLASFQRDYKVTLTANPDYHEGKPIVEGIDRPVKADSVARQNDYESGALDFTDVDRADLDRIQRDPVLGPQLKEFPRAAIWYLALNQQVFEPFKKRDVRRAFAYAINKDELIRLALKGTVQRAEGILPPGVLGYDPNFKGIPYDPAKARGLLAGAGYPGGKDFPKFTITFRQGYGYIKDGALAIMHDLHQNLGIEVSVKEMEWSQLLTERHNGTLPSIHLRWGADYLDPQNFLSTLLRTGTEENQVGYSNPEFDRLCDQADVERDEQKRIAMYRQAEKIAVEDAPWVCIYFQKDVELHKPYVKGIRDSLMGHLPHISTDVRR